MRGRARGGKGPRTWASTAQVLLGLGLSILWIGVSLGDARLWGQGELSLPTVTDIDAQIQAVEQMADVDEATRTKVKEIYQSALVGLQELKAFEDALARDQKLRSNADERLATFRSSLATAPKPVTIEDTETISKLEARITAKQTEVTAVRSALDKVTSQLTLQQQRPDQRRIQLATARERLSQVQEELIDAFDVGVPTLTQEASLVQLQIRVAKRRAEIAALEQEMIVYDARLELLSAERDLLKRDLEAVNQDEAKLQGALGALRTKEAQEAARVADQRAAEAVVPAIQAVLSDNAELIRRNSSTTERVEELSARLREVQANKNRLSTEFDTTRRKVEEIGLSGILGEILSEKRRELRRGAYGQLTHVDRRVDLYETQAQALRVEDRLEYLEKDQGERRFQEILERIKSGRRVRGRTPDPSPREGGAPTTTTDAESSSSGNAEGAEGSTPTTVEETTPIPRPLTPVELAEIATELRDALSKEVEALRRLRDTYARHRRVLSNLEFEERALQSVYQRYSQFLNERLLWTPSTRVLSATDLESVISDTRSMLELGQWQRVADTFEGAWAQKSVVVTLVFLCALVLVLLRRFWRFRLRSLAERVGKKYADGYYVTAGALIVTFALAAPVPLFLMIAALVFDASRVSSTFTAAIVQALFTTSIGSFVLLFTIQLVAREGVAIVHFGWSERTTTQLRRAARILLFTAVPLFAMSEVARGLPELVSDIVERLAFLSSMLLVTAYTLRLLSPNHGLLQQVLQTPLGKRFYRLRYVWYPVAVLIPFSVALLSYSGYHYTARQFDYRLLQSLVLVLAGIVVHNLIVRWLLIARRRLAVARNLEKKRETEGDSGAGVEAEEVVDLATLKRQSHRIANISVIGGVLLSVIGVWADVLPALGFFDFELWKVTSEVAGESVLRSVTLANVLSALMVVIFAFLGSRSLPGFLELSALRRLSIDPGNRYAVATIGQYSLVAVGVVVAFQLIGVGWGQVQWLIAALGVGLGFGLQEIFANFVSGLILLLERPIRVGDTVTVGSISGIVSRIRIRATTITDWDQKELIVPNKAFITGELINWTLTNPITRLIVKVGVAYGSDTQKTVELLHKAAKEHPLVLSDPPPGVFFIGFGSSSLDFDLRVFVRELSNRGRTGIIHDLNMVIDQLFREHHVTIAFPQLDVHFDAETPLRVDAEGSSPLAKFAAANKSGEDDPKPA